MALGLWRQEGINYDRQVDISIVTTLRNHTYWQIYGRQRHYSYLYNGGYYRAILQPLTSDLPHIPDHQPYIIFQPSINPAILTGRSSHIIVKLIVYSLHKYFWILLRLHNFIAFTVKAAYPLIYLSETFSQVYLFHNFM